MNREFFNKFFGFKWKDRISKNMTFKQINDFSSLFYQEMSEWEHKLYADKHSNGILNIIFCLHCAIVHFSFRCGLIFKFRWLITFLTKEIYTLLAICHAFNPICEIWDVFIVQIKRYEAYCITNIMYTKSSRKTFILITFYNLNLHT